MIVELRALTEGESLSFADSLDLSHLDFSGQVIFPEPIRLSGAIERRADVIRLKGRYETMMSLRCDRCGVLFQKELSEPLALVLAEQREAGDREDIYILTNGGCNISEVFEPDIILSAPSKTLCSESCEGLCPRCGHELNQGPCACAPETDPRWDALRTLIDN